MKNRRNRPLSLARETLRVLTDSEARGIGAGVAGTSNKYGGWCSTQTLSHCDPCATLVTACQ